MKRLLIDVSHVLKAIMFVAGKKDSAITVEFEGKNVSIPDPAEAYEIYIMALRKALEFTDMRPINCVLVKDGVNCKAMRREFLSGYCKREEGAPEWMESFNECLSMVEELTKNYGGIVVYKDGVEADDIIAAFGQTVEDSVIWSGDKDMLGVGVPVYYKGEWVTSEDKFLGIPSNRVVVYKALVGDQSDKIPGCPGLGQKAFIDMIVKFDMDVLDDIKELIEGGRLHELEDFVSEFKPFQKVIDNQDEVYASYECAKFHHPGWDIKLEAGYPTAMGIFPSWDPVVELITKDKLTKEKLFEISGLINNSPNVALDIETWTPDEGKQWMVKNKNKQGKMPLDVIGQRLTGFSLTIGENSQITYYFPIDHAATNCITMEQARTILNMMPNPDVTDTPLLVQNTSFELSVLRLHFELGFDRGWLPWQNLYDTKIMAGYVDEYGRAGLKENSRRWLNYKQVSYEEVTTKVDENGNERQVGMNELSGLEVLSYGCDDTICTSALYRLYKLFMDYENTWNCYERVDVPVQVIYTERFLNGIEFDEEMRSKLQKENNEKYTELFSDILDFVAELEWEEEVEGDNPVQRVSVEDFKKMMSGEKKPHKRSEPQTVIRKWDGCEFDPADELSPTEIKRLYQIHTGDKLNCRARLLNKIASAIRYLGEIEFAEYVDSEDLGGLNNYVQENFVPVPKLKLNSPKQMTKLLYEALGLPVRIRGKLSDAMRSKGQKSGNPSANEDALRHAIVYDLQGKPEVVEFLEKIIEAKACLTAEGLYFKPYKNFPHYSDGMVHPQFKLSAQKSGRGTAATPNDAQVAKGSGIRKIYRPYTSLGKQYVWVSMDFSSQELAHIAWHCQDQNMLSCFTGDWRDIHSVTGSEIMSMESGKNITYEEFNSKRKTEDEFKKIRNLKAKPTNFLKTYGGTAHTLAIDLLCSEEQAEMFLEALGRAFPGIDPWIESKAVEHRRQGYAVTPMGRRRHLWRVLDGSWKDDHEIRGAGNHPIQGGSAEQVKLVVGRMWKERVFDRVDAFFAGTVHDEVNALVEINSVIEYLKMAHPIMTQPFAGFGIDFRSSIEIGPNFGELTEIGTEIDETAINNLLEELRWRK